MALIDMFLNAQGGQNVEALAKQFGLSQAQAASAIEAMMPAFSQGLKRNTADPMGAGAFIQALSSGQHANYFDNPQAAFKQAGISEGNGILGHLFGSKDLSRAVADQAAQATGIGNDVIKQMLPAVASMLMGGLFKQSTGQFAAANTGSGGNVIGDLIEQMMRQSGQAPGQTAPQQAPGQSDNPLGDILGQIFGGGQASPAPQPQQQAGAPAGQDNPLGRIFEEMMRGGQAGGQGSQQRAPQQAPGQSDNPLGDILGQIFGGSPGGAPQQPSPTQAQAPAQTPRSGNPLDDILGQMFETGKQTSNQYQKGVESIFDQYLKGMDRRR
ncbi:MAG: DUF937 domain-containing protein [Phyllobacterium sp.]